MNDLNKSGLIRPIRNDMPVSKQIKKGKCDWDRHEEKA